jgi:hypothetical protein
MIAIQPQIPRPFRRPGSVLCCFVFCLTSFTFNWMHEFSYRSCILKNADFSDKQHHKNCYPSSRPVSNEADGLQLDPSHTKETL